MSSDDHFSVASGGGGVVVPSTTYFSSQKVDFVMNRQDGGFCMSQSHHKAPLK